MRSLLNIKTYSIALLVSMLAIYGLSGITSISPGEVGLKIKMLGENRGMQKDTLDTGMYWIEPFLYDVVSYDTRSYQETLNDLTATTKDGQPVQVDLSLEISLRDSYVPQLHETVGKDYFDKIVYPAIRSSIRNNIPSQLSDNVYTQEGRLSIQDVIQKDMEDKFLERGIVVHTNLRDVTFVNNQFVATLERKASAAQEEIIEQRLAAAAVQQAIKVANQAEGAKQKRIKEAEAEKEELRLKGEGERLKKEEEAKGILAIAKANAEGTRLQVMAYGDGKTYASVKWAENLGPNVKVYGIPTGSPGTASMMDLNGILGGAFKGVTPK